MNILFKRGKNINFGSFDTKGGHFGHADCLDGRLDEQVDREK